MYWYFDKGGDDDNGDLQIHIHHSNAQVHKNFNFQLPFFGFRFNYTRVKLYFTTKQKGGSSKFKENEKPTFEFIFCLL